MMNWTLQRKDNRQTLNLHAQFHWADEYEWTPLAQTEPVYTLTGAMDIQQGTKLAGRPITLNGDNTWTSRADIKTLQQWSEVPELEMTLTHPDGRSFKVIFSRPALDNIQAVKNYKPADQSNNDVFRLIIRFLTIN